MAEKEPVYMALFDDLDCAVRAIEGLHEIGIKHEDMEVITAVPFEEEVLGRPHVRELMPRITVTGAIIGFITALLFLFGTVYDYPIRVGGHPYFTIPPKIVIMYELTMLGIIISTFLGAVVWESPLPSYSPKPYDPSISDGRIAVVFKAAGDLLQKAIEIVEQFEGEAKEATWRPL